MTICRNPCSDRSLLACSYSRHSVCFLFSISPRGQVVLTWRSQIHRCRPHIPLSIRKRMLHQMRVRIPSANCRSQSCFQSNLPSFSLPLFEGRRIFPNSHLRRLGRRFPHPSVEGPIYMAITWRPSRSRRGLERRTRSLCSSHQTKYTWSSFRAHQSPALCRRTRKMGLFLLSSRRFKPI
jgi:hypothetical protein